MPRAPADDAAPDALGSGLSAALLRRRLDHEHAARRSTEARLARLEAALAAADRDLGAERARSALIEAERDALRAANRDPRAVLAPGGPLADDGPLTRIAHELRTPLHALVGIVELLGETPLDGEQRGFVETLRRSADALRAVVDDGLRPASPEGGDVVLERRVLDPLVLAQDAVALLRPQAEQRSVSLLLWSGELPASVLGDPPRLQQVWTGLLSHALGRTAHGEVRLDLRGEWIGTGTWRLRASVTDTGPVLDAASRDRLRDTLAADSAATSSVVADTDRGLSAAARLLRRMGGTISVHDDRAGLRLVCVLDLPEDAPRQAGTAGATPLSRLRVLLAEDDPVNRSLALAVLARLGVEARVAADGRAAVLAACEGDFDVVLMDVRMPLLDGLQATRAIRAMPAGRTRPWIVALTADALERDRQRCLAAGMDDFIAKPCRPDAVRAALDRALRRARSPDGRPRVARGFA